MPDPADQPVDLGLVVLCLNAHGVAEVFGPMEVGDANRHAAFCARLVPTWIVDLSGPDGSPTVERVVLDEQDGPRAESERLPEPTE